jgi:DNA ligase-1
MLAGKAPDDLESLDYPVLVSPKLDGIRCLIVDGVAVSRNLKPIPNEYIRRQLSELEDGFDGELMLRSTAGFNSIQSAVMTRDGEPNFVYRVFDTCKVSGPFRDRLKIVKELIAPYIRVELVPHAIVYSKSRLLACEHKWLADGYEGLMIRDPDGAYKQGRSTTREGGLLKLKRFSDAEADVIGVQEKMHNANEATTDVFGRTERSSHKENMIPTSSLGALICRTPEGVQFNIGTGFTESERKRLWIKRKDIIGRVVTYKHQPDPSGESEAPRFPVFMRFRKDGA